jgi:CRP-like cAMP-binding protein
MEKEEKINVILSKYIPLLKKEYTIHELKKEHLLKNTDHDECYIIKEGSVLAEDEKGKTFILEPGAPIGFAESLANRPYELNYFLKEEVKVFAFKSSNLRKAFASSSSLTRGIIKYSLDRVFHNNKSKTYHLIDDGFLSKQKVKFPIKSYSNDATIFIRNQKPKFFFFVESGKVQLISKLDKVIATFNPGDSFGESALFTDTVRSATAKSVGNTSLHLVGVDFIKNFFEDEDTLIKFCLICILERLRVMNNMRNLIN